jgi:serine/threonine-protein kinase
MLQGGVTLDERYVLREPIGRGGMGVVWRADDTLLGRVVAVKVLLSDLSGETEFAERFYAEARAMAALSDPHIVEVYDYGQAFGMAYLVMQFIPGEPLHAVLRRAGALPPHQVMTLVAQAARALHHAHINGFVHRDVKPGNLLIRPDGRLVLTDFGIARSIAASRLTQSGFIVGTPSYLAPEQFAGAPSGPAADIYALGVVAYECLALRPPFVGDTPAALAAMQVRNEPPPLPPSVPESVRTVVMRALAKEPWQRWPTAAAMADAAVAAAAGAVVPWVPEHRPGSAPATGPTVPIGPTSPDIAARPLVPVSPAGPWVCLRERGSAVPAFRRTSSTGGPGAAGWSS